MRVGIAGIGPPGPPGQALEFKGPWSAITIYDNDDSVQRNGSMWVAVAPSTNVDPATDDGSHWKLAASKGDTGAVGAAGATGPPGLTWQGAWSAATAYVVNDAVSYNGASYRCILNRSATATTPDADATHWAVLAAKGDTGAAGAAGATGAPGLTWQGAWSAATAYVVNDAVSYSGSSYRCILNRSATATTPDADATHWAVLAAEGSAGSALTIKSKAIGGGYTDITEPELAFKDFTIEVTHEAGTRVLIGGLSPTFESVDDGPYGSSINAGASHDFSWDPSNGGEYKRGLLITRLKVDRASRIRLYHNATYRTADVGRAVGTDPTGDHGLILECVFTGGLLDLVLSPQVMVLSKALDEALVGSITNNGATGAVNPEFTAVALR